MGNLYTVLVIGRQPKRAAGKGKSSLKDELKNESQKNGVWWYKSGEVASEFLYNFVNLEVSHPVPQTKEFLKDWGNYQRPIPWTHLAKLTHCSGCCILLIVQRIHKIPVYFLWFLSAVPLKRVRWCRISHPLLSVPSPSPRKPYIFIEQHGAY
jgi:hypothetical protein